MKKNFRTMMLAMATLGFFSCSDKLADDAGQTTNETSDGCVTFKISTIGNGTRAVDDSFNAGSETEYAITTTTGANIAFFFDSSNKFLSKSALQVLGTTNGSHDTEHEEKTAEKYFSARVQKTKDGSSLKCVIILNGDPNKLANLSLTSGSTDLSTFLEEQDKWKGTGQSGTANNPLGRYTEGETTYFTMSNTVYAKSDQSAVECAVTIDGSKIYSTTAQAEADPIVVHVERVAAKFQLTFTGETNSSILDGSNIIKVTDLFKEGEKENKLVMMVKGSENKLESQEVSWGVKILGWNVNGTETATYLTKNLTVPTDGKFGLWNFEYGASSNGWNDVSRLRSYWAIDPHYNNNQEDIYPQQRREAKNEDGITSYTTDAVLNYISYNNIGNDITNNKYAPENTFGAYNFLKENTNTDGTYLKTAYAYTGDDFKRPGTHILIAAELLLGNELTNGTVSSDTYCYGGYFWKASLLDELIDDMVKQVCFDYETEEKTTLFVDMNGSKTALSTVAGHNYFKLEEIATIKGGDGRLMLSIKDNITLYQGSTAENSVELKEENLATLQNQIYSTGTAQHFKDGKMYYAIPIEHMADHTTTTVNNNKVYYYNIGSYGVVRNHWYAVNVKKITTPGVPVDDPDQPIIPSDEPDEVGYVAFEIVIIPWHKIDQNVEF